MADSNNTPVAPNAGKERGAGASENSGGGTPVFRLPKFFTQSAESGAAEGRAQTPASAPAGAPTDAPSGAEKAPAMQALVQPAPPEPPPAGAPSKSSVVAAELSELRDEIERLTDQVTQVNERESSLERVFDTLHAELSDYKNDFLYEHLKPVIRPLLFLFDSIEQFDSEIAMTQDAAPNPTPNPGTLAAFVVRENVEYFRDQLIEALQVCEVTLMDAPRGAFNPKFHKAVDVMPVEREKDGTIVRVVRSGWFLNGQLLRPAEVVVGKFRAPNKPATAPGSMPGAAPVTAPSAAPQQKAGSVTSGSAAPAGAAPRGVAR